MTFEEILDQAIAMLQRRGRLTYGALKRQFQLDDAYLEDLKNELIEGLVEGRGGVLRLAVITCEALLRFEAATLSGFRVFFDVSYGGGHRVLLDSVGVCGGCSLPKRTCCEHGIPSASRALRTSCFLLSTMCGIQTLERPFPFPHRLLRASLG